MIMEEGQWCPLHGSLLPRCSCHLPPLDAHGLLQKGGRRDSVLSHPSQLGSLFFYQPRHEHHKRGRAHGLRNEVNSRKEERKSPSCEQSVMGFLFQVPALT